MFFIQTLSSHVYYLGMRFKLTNKLGVLGEQLALREYLKHGYRLIARNSYNSTGKRVGELDIIVERQKVIVFVEVKTRQGPGNAAESVHFLKQQKLIKAAQWFLFHNPKYAGYQPRIDVCLVRVSRFDTREKTVIILPNAVELTGWWVVPIFLFNSRLR